jgi:U3 small nucleolar RNA-associated protein 12
VEVFRVRADDEIRKKQARRKKRADAKAAVGKGEKANDVVDNGDMEKVELADVFTPYLVVRATGKIKSFALPDGARPNGATQVRCHYLLLDFHLIHFLQLFFALSNNAIEVYSIPQYTKSKENPPEAARLYSLDLPGHRTDVRTLSLSSDDTLLASASNG